MGGIPGDRLPPLALDCRDPGAVILDHQQRDLRRQRRADEAPDAAVTHEHHMIGEPGGRNAFAGGGFLGAGGVHG
jgi:hypothetical protein